MCNRSCALIPQSQCTVARRKSSVESRRVELSSWIVEPRLCVVFTGGSGCLNALKATGWTFSFQQPWRQRRSSFTTTWLHPVYTHLAGYSLDGLLQAQQYRDCHNPQLMVVMSKFITKDINVSSLNVQQIWDFKKNIRLEDFYFRSQLFSYQ